MSNSEVTETLDSPRAVTFGEKIRDSVESFLFKRFHHRQFQIERIFYFLTFSSSLFVLILFGALIFSLSSGAWLALSTFGWSFLTTVNWDPVQDQFGALGPMTGTLVTSILALLMAVPVCFGIAIFLTELAPKRLRTLLGTLIELLAAIPSVIYGMWGLFIFAPYFAKNISPWISHTIGPLPIVGPFFQGPPMGIGVFSASVILAVMIVPYITAIMRDVFLIVPPILKESAFGLGSTTWEVAFKVVLPYTRNGVIGGILLGLGRALGETMAVTFVIGNSHNLTKSLLMPGSTISSTLANEFSEAVSPMHTSALVGLGLILFAITFIVLVLSKLLLLKLKQNEGKN